MALVAKETVYPLDYQTDEYLEPLARRIVDNVSNFILDDMNIWKVTLGDYITFEGAEYSEEGNLNKIRLIFDGVLWRGEHQIDSTAGSVLTSAIKICYKEEQERYREAWPAYFFKAKDSDLEGKLSGTNNDYAISFGGLPDSSIRITLHTKDHSKTGYMFNAMADLLRVFMGMAGMHGMIYGERLKPFEEVEDGES